MKIQFILSVFNQFILLSLVWTYENKLIKMWEEWEANTMRNKIKLTILTIILTSCYFVLDSVDSISQTNYIIKAEEQEFNIFPQDSETHRVPRCIDQLKYKAKTLGAKGIENITWQINYYIPNGWHSYVRVTTCQTRIVK